MGRGRNREALTATLSPPERDFLHRFPTLIREEPLPSGQTVPIFFQSMMFEEKEVHCMECKRPDRRIVATKPSKEQQSTRSTTRNSAEVDPDFLAEWDII